MLSDELCKITETITTTEVTKFWFGEIITIGQVKFHPETFRPYYFDCAANKKQKEKELDEIIQEQRKEIVISEVGQKHLK